MKASDFSDSHLEAEPERLNRFRSTLDKLVKTRGYCTISLEEYSKSWDSKIGNLDYWISAYSDSDIEEDSGKSLSDFLILGSSTPYQLKFGINRIGRFEDNDLVIDDMFVSRRHCCIVVHSDGRAELFDTASSNGTYVNDVEITHCWLISGDEIRLADTYHLTISLVDDVALKAQVNTIISEGDSMSSHKLLMKSDQEQISRVDIEERPCIRISRADIAEQMRLLLES